jgi:hypothetical protein
VKREIRRKLTMVSSNKVLKSNFFIILSYGQLNLERTIQNFKKTSHDFIIFFYFHKKTFKSSLPFVKKAQSRLKALFAKLKFKIKFLWSFFKATNCGLWFQIRLPMWLNDKIQILFSTLKLYSRTEIRQKF